MQSGLRLLHGSLLGRDRRFALVHRRGTLSDRLPLLLARRQRGRKLGIALVQRGAQLVDVREPLFEFTVARLQPLSCLLQFRLAALEFLLLFGELPLPTR